MRIAAILLVLAACEDQYVYTPEVTNAQQGGFPASRTAIPPERPEGAVQITSSGIEEVAPSSGKVHVIHVRMVVSNDGDDTPWTLDTRQQMLQIPGQPLSAPLFVNSDEHKAIITIARGERHVIDLFYSMPGKPTESRLPQFDLVWNVDTSERRVASRTSFDRQEIVPQIAYSDWYGAPYYYGWGSWGGYGYGWGSPGVPVVAYGYGRVIETGADGRGGHGGHR